MAWVDSLAVEVDFNKTPPEQRVNEWVMPPYKRGKRVRIWKGNPVWQEARAAKEQREEIAMKTAKRSAEEEARIDKQAADYEAEKSRLKALVPTTVVSRNATRTGRKPAAYGRRARCPYVDPETGEQCPTTYSTVNSLHYMHFNRQHPDGDWDGDLVEWVDETEEDWQKSTKPKPTAEPETAKEVLKKVAGRARGLRARSKASLLYLYVCQVPRCTYTNKSHASNFKAHVLKAHPQVEYSPSLRKTVLKEDYEEAQPDQD